MRVFRRTAALSMCRPVLIIWSSVLWLYNPCPSLGRGQRRPESKLAAGASCPSTELSFCVATGTPVKVCGGLSPFQQVCLRPHLLLWALRSVTLTRLWGQPSWPLEPSCLISHGFEPSCGHIPSSSLPQHARCQLVFPKSYGISAQHSFQLKNIFKTFERKCIAFFWLSRRHTACRKFDQH